MKNEGVYYPVSNISALTEMVKTGKLYVAVTGANTSDAEQTFKMVTSQYSGDIMSAVQLTDVTFAAESFADNVYEITVNPAVAESDAGMNRVMCMLLDLDSIAPIAKQTEVK